MVESSDEPSLLDRSRSSPGPAHASSSDPFGTGSHSPVFSLNDDKPLGRRARVSTGKWTDNDDNNTRSVPCNVSKKHVAAKVSTALPPPAPPPNEKGQGSEATPLDSEGQHEEKSKIHIRFYRCCRNILFASWLNVLLVFVPLGIAVQAAGVNKNIVFGLNAVAIVPLAGLLSYATESVASEMGDTIGALMNVTFGNAVELIIL